MASTLNRPRRKPARRRRLSLQFRLYRRLGKSGGGRLAKSAVDFHPRVPQDLDSRKAGERADTTALQGLQRCRLREDAPRAIRLFLRWGTSKRLAGPWQEILRISNAKCEI